MRIGVDTGGTFTDAVACAADGTLSVLKLPSRPSDPAAAVLDAAAQLSGGRPARELVHGTTVATNALLERSGGPAVLVTTAGFEDLLLLGRQTRPQLYALHPTVVPPLIAPELCLGLDERIGPDGRVLTAPSAAALTALRDQVARLVVSGARSIAVCLLHAYANAAHERQVAEALAGLGVPIPLSSQVLPRHREYERASTTAVDAYVAPAIAPYVARLHAGLGDATRLRLLSSAGGAVAAVDVLARPSLSVLSGPAAGVVGATTVAARAGARSLLTLDMGGTSTDVALVDKEPALLEEAQIAGCVVCLPMLAVHTVAAGGGSIATLDGGGALKVGPHSAGAAPGPAAYGRGGELPTLTDANLVLGRLSPTHLLGGSVSLDAERASAALAPLAARLGVSVTALAERLVAVAEAALVRALRTVSVARGADPRDYTLVAFGGAGGLHAVPVAAELGMRRVLVPPAPGLLCAFGALAADFVYDQLDGAIGAWDGAVATARFSELERAATAALDREGVAPAWRRVEREAHLRYVGQSYELAVQAGGSDVVAAFHAAHHARFGHAFADRAVERVGLRVRARGAGDVPAFRFAPEPGEPRCGEVMLRAAGRDMTAPVLRRERLRPGTELAGPALLVEYSATTYLPAGATTSVLADGTLDIRPL